jgi:hypothetical protein
MRRKIKVDFFRVEMPKDISSTFEELLQKLSVMPSNKRTLIMEDGKPLNPHSIEKDGEFWKGEILFIRNTDLPTVTDSLGNPIDNYNSDEICLGERAIFLYHQETKVLLLHKAKLGAPLSMISNYMKIKFDIPGKIELKPVLSYQAMKQLSKISEVRKFEIHVAGLDSPAPLNHDDVDPDEVTELYEKFRSPTIVLELSMGLRKDSNIDLERVRKISDFWTKLTEETFSQRKPKEKLGRRATTIKITGATDEEEQFLIDLLRERVKELIDFESPDKTLSYQMIVLVLKEAWKKRSEDISLLFSQDS